jgi:hypothetical protein
MMTAKQAAPDALLLITPTCPHCPAVLQTVSEMVKLGQIGQLEVVNIAVHPERAARLGVRSVPWLKLGEFELEGLHSPGELRTWAGKAGTTEGLADYFNEQLKAGHLPRVAAHATSHPDTVDALLMLAENPDTELTVRIGVSAVIEDLAGSDSLLSRLPALEKLAGSDDARVRADACHFLALTEDRRAVALLEILTGDPERAVREVAEDSLKELNEVL